MVGLSRLWIAALENVFALADTLDQTVNLHKKTVDIMYMYVGARMGAAARGIDNLLQALHDKAARHEPTCSRIPRHQESGMG